MGPLGQGWGSVTSQSDDVERIPLAEARQEQRNWLLAMVRYFFQLLAQTSRLIHREFPNPLNLGGHIVAEIVAKSINLSMCS